MRRSAVIIGLVLLLISLGSAFAVTLQQGWYAGIAGVQVYVWNESANMNVLYGDATFSTPLGHYGPFTLVNNPGYGNHSREANINSTSDNFGSDDSLILPLDVLMSQGSIFSFLGVSWQTNYDASVMNLELWNTKSDGTSRLIWTQNKSGIQADSTNLANWTTVDGTYYFKINIVPEPQLMTTCAFTGICGLAAFLQKNRKVI